MAKLTLFGQSAEISDEEAEQLSEEARKLRTGEAVERRLELCVDCPMHGRYVPVIGNCYDAQLITEPERKPLTAVKLHGDPEGFLYELNQICPHALDAEYRMLSTKDLRAVVCDYRKE